MSSMAYAVTNATRIVRNSFFVNNGERNSFFVNNGELTSQAGYDSSCVDFWGSIVENEDVSSDDLGQIRFKPNIIHATKYICNEDYQMILDAHKNKLVYAEQNYGYIKVTSPKDGKQVGGWLMKMKRSPLNKIAKFTLLERFTGCGIGCMIIQSTLIVG
jgi:hypothetical protein